MSRVREIVGRMMTRAWIERVFRIAAPVRVRIRERVRGKESSGTGALVCCRLDSRFGESVCPGGELLECVVGRRFFSGCFSFSLGMP